jgi:hypothetical protein
MRQRERGSAVLLTMIVIVALLGGGAVLLGMQISSTRSTELTRSNMTALYCAEAGLNAARPIIGSNYPWDANLGTGVQPAYLLHPTLLNHDLDGDGVSDYTITLKDNDDEGALGLANNPARDNDLTIWVISTCTKFPENQKQVSELIRYNIRGELYKDQAGGKAGIGTDN